MCATQPIARTVRAAADKEENRGKPRFCFYMPVHEPSAGLFGTGCPVHTNCVSVFALMGRLLFCTDPAGRANCRRRVRPFRAGSFSLNLSGDSPSADGGSVAAPAAGAKRKDNLRFSFLFELLPFPCFLIRRRFPICDRFENRERQSGYRSVSFSAFSQFTDSVLLHRWVHLSRRDITASRNSLTRYTAWHLRIRRLVQFIFVALSIIMRSRLARHGYVAPCGDETTCVAVR